MRVLSVIHGPVFGGAHAQAIRLRAPLEASGIETVAVLPEEAEPAASRMRDDGLETLTVRLGRLRASPDPVLQARFAAHLWGDVRALRKLIKERDIDVVQIHGVTNPQGGFAARREGAATVWQLFDTRAPLAVRRLAKPLVERLPDSMTVWGQALADMHPGTERMGDRLIVVFPPVNPVDFAPSEELRRQARHRLRIPDEALAVGTVGVRNPQKAHDRFVRAAASVRRAHPEAVFRVLGAPSPAHAKHMAHVEELARGLGLGDPKDFDFIDPKGDVATMIHALDVFAMTSVPRSEGMPTALLEAMAAGIPVVSTNVGAVTELVGDEAGLIVPAEDDGAMAAAIGGLLAHPDRRSAMGSAGRARSTTTFSLDALAARHEEAYRIAVEHAKQTRG